MTTKTTIIFQQDLFKFGEKSFANGTVHLFLHSFPKRNL